MARAAGPLPESLSHRLPRKLLQAHREWVREVTDELTPGADGEADRPADRPGGSG